jgi:hypothetical protein
MKIQTLLFFHKKLFKFTLQGVYLINNFEIKRFKTRAKGLWQKLKHHQLSGPDFDG